MKEIELKAELATHAESIGRLRRRRITARPQYDIMSDAIVWSDEIDGLSSDAVSVLRFVFRYRTSVFIGEPDTGYADLWAEAQRLFPSWIGFHCSRTSPKPSVVRLYQSRKTDADRELDKQIKK